MRTIHFYCMAPKGDRYQVYLQERVNTVKVSEEETAFSFPFTLQGWKDAQVWLLEKNISANADVRS